MPRLIDNPHTAYADLTEWFLLGLCFLGHKIGGSVLSAPLPGRRDC